MSVGLSVVVKKYGQFLLADQKMEFNSERQGIPESIQFLYGCSFWKKIWRIIKIEDNKNEFRPGADALPI